MRWSEVFRALTFHRDHLRASGWLRVQKVLKTKSRLNASSILNNEMVQKAQPAVRDNGIYLEA